MGANTLKCRANEFKADRLTLRQMRKLLVMVVLVCALGGLSASVPGAASAAGLSAPVADCDSNGTLTHHYSAAALRQALATMPADVAEYTNCPDVIRRALLSQLGTISGGDSTGGGGSSFLPGWAIAVLVVLVLAGAAAGAIAVRNRRRES